MRLSSEREQEIRCDHFCGLGKCKICELLSEIDALRAEYVQDGKTTHLGDAHLEIGNLKERVAKLREVLVFYSNHIPYSENAEFHRIYGYGKRATEVLAQDEKRDRWVCEK